LWGEAFQFLLLGQEQLFQKIALEDVHQVVHGEHQFTSRLADIFVSGQINRSRHYLAVTLGQGQLFVTLTEAAEQSAHCLDEFLRVGNALQGGGRGHCAGLDAFEQATFKRRTAFGSVGVNFAQLPVKTPARLDERAFHSLLFEAHSEVNQPSGVVALLQFHVCEQHAVAAQAAVGAKLQNGIV